MVSQKSNSEKIKMNARYYKKTAEENEPLFRNVLRDMQKRCSICPKDFNPEEPIDKIIERYSTGNRNGKFTICDFAIGPSKDGLVELAEKEALIDVQDIACLSGHGYSLIYEVKEDNSVKFNRKGFVRMSLI